MKKDQTKYELLIAVEKEFDTREEAIEYADKITDYQTTTIIREVIK